MDAATIVGLLAEPERLAVVSALVLGARSPGEVVAATGLPARDVGRALQKLQAAGLAESVDHATLRRYLIDQGLLSRAAGEYWRSGGRLDALT